MGADSVGGTTYYHGRCVFDSNTNIGIVEGAKVLNWLVPPVGFTLVSQQAMLVGRCVCLAPFS